VTGRTNATSSLREMGRYVKLRSGYTARAVRVPAGGCSGEDEYLFPFLRDEPRFPARPAYHQAILALLPSRLTFKAEWLVYAPLAFT
jgi:hypothetical protein